MGYFARLRPLLVLLLVPVLVLLLYSPYSQGALRSGPKKGKWVAAKPQNLNARTLLLDKAHLYTLVSLSGFGLFRHLGHGVEGEKQSGEQHYENIRIKRKTHGLGPASFSDVLPK